jgi:hypothetical protein
MHQETSACRQGRMLSLTARGLACASLAAALLSACTFAEPGYNQLIGMARTDCRGNEIVGVWVDRQENPLGDLTDLTFSNTVLFRSDGTGKFRYGVAQTRGLPGPQSSLYDLSYRYVGSGVWRFVVRSEVPCPGKARISGDRLLIEGWLTGANARRIYTRADTNAAVEYERARR